MADTYTTNLNLTKPEPGAAEDTWGISLNADLDALDAIFSSSGTQINLNPNQINFADNKKAIFGTGSDLEIFHDGSHSYIDDAGVGDLVLRGNNQVLIRDKATNDVMVNCRSGQFVKLYYNNAEKLATTSSGISVTGTVTSDGLTVDGNTSSQTYRSSRTDGDVYIQATTDTDFVKIGTQTKINALLVDGSGDISFYDDTGTSASLFWDASAERLGIGTTSPSELLHIYNTGGAGNDANVLIEGNGSGVNAKLTIDGHVSGGQLDLTYRSNTQSKTVAMRCLNDGSFRIDTLGSEAMRIVGDNVGIGTTSPAGELHVVGTSGGNGDVYVGRTSGAEIHTQAQSATGIFGTSSNHDLAFKTNGTQRMRIDTSGNVGIGTTSPSFAGGSGLEIERAGIATLRLQDTTNVANVELQSGESGLHVRVGANGSSGDLFNVSSAGTSRLLIDTSGNVGIGTDSPDSLFHVVGSSTVQTVVTMEQTDVTLAINQPVGVFNFKQNDLGSGAGVAAKFGAFAEGNNGEVGLRYYTGSGNTTTERMRIDSSGRVGIGTTSPTSPLTIKSSSTSGSTSGLLLQGNSNTNTIVAIGEKSTDGGRLHMYDGGVEKIAFYTDGTANHISAGNVGIGTDSPDTMLHLSDTLGNAVIRLERNDTGIVNGDQYGAIEFEGQDINTDASGVRASIRAKATASLGQTALTFSTASNTATESERMRIAPGGYVGIGTDSPNEELHLLNSGNTTLQIQTTGGGTPTLKLASPVGTEEITANVGSVRNMVFRIGGSERARFDNNGQLGIGTTSPSATLEVNGGADAIAKITGASTAARLDLATTNHHVFMQLIESDGRFRIYDQTAANEYLTISNAGNIGIGTSSPSTKLQVAGIVQINESGETAFYEGQGVRVFGTQNYRFRNASGGTRAIIDVNSTGVTAGNLSLYNASNVVTSYINNAGNSYFNGGNVGIGTTSPSQKLHVLGSSTNQAAVTKIQRVQASASNNTYTFEVDSSAHTSNMTSGGAMAVDVNGGRAFTINGMGNVGIGTATPNYLLDVEGSGSLLRVNSTSGNNIVQLSVPDTTSITGVNFGDSGSTNAGYIWYRHNGDSLAFSTAGTEAIRILANGNTGIGTTSPKSLLNVTGTGADGGILTLENDSSSLITDRKVGQIHFYSNDGSANGTGVKADIKAIAENSIGSEIGLAFGTSGTGSATAVEAMRISANGSVGIGTDSPSSSIDVFSSDANIAKFTRDLTTDVSLNVSADNDGTILSTGGVHNFRVFTNSSESARIDASGRLLVGTTSDGGDGISLRPRASGSSTTSQIRFNRADTTNSGIALLFMNNTQTVGQISHTNTATTYATSSDARLKDVTGEARGLEVITKLNPVAYNWKADGKADEGLIAQEVKELVPNAVTGSEDEHYQMDYSKLVTHLVKGMKEQQEQIESLKSEIANLKGE